MKWITKDRKQIEITELTDDHLKNIVNFIKRKGYVETETAMSCLAYACTTSAEMASMAAEQAFLEMKTSRLADTIFAEYERRKKKT